MFTSKRRNTKPPNVTAQRIGEEIDKLSPKLVEGSK